MMTFIFAAGVLVRNMDGFADTTSFLTFQASEPNGTLTDNEERHERQLDIEVYLLATILCYIAFSSLGVMILPWTLISELFPIEVSETR
jgi:hypothetical protein